MEAGIIGSGNLAWHLAQRCAEKGIPVRFIAGRNKKEVSALAKKCNAEVCTDIPPASSKSFLLFLCVADDAIQQVAGSSQSLGYHLIHCSGMKLLLFPDKQEVKSGVFYPVQSFSKKIETDWDTIPVCLESNNPATLKLLKKFSKSIAGKSQKLNSEQRATVHLAAVFANNFANAQFIIASEILKEAGLPLALVKPLILQTAKKTMQFSPEEIQTGPARRHDLSSIKAHKMLLKKNPSALKVYSTLTEFLLKHYPK